MFRNYLLHATRAFFAFAILTGSGAFGATSFDMEADVAEWVGGGPNTAFIVLDFDESAEASGEIVFGVQFTSDTISGEDVLRTLDAATDLDVTSHTTQWGLFIDGFRYVHQGTTYTAQAGGEWPEGTWWSYWLSADYGEAWESAMTGLSDRFLSDGDTDGWRFQAYSTQDLPPNGPRAPRSSSAYLEQSVVEWAGAGERTGFIVLDFDVSTTESAEFAFGIHFSTRTLTGLEAIELLAAETDVEITSHSTAWGLMIDGFSYTHDGVYYESIVGGEWPDGTWWEYFASPDYGGSWFSSMVGASQRAFHHGDSDAWQFKMYNDYGALPNGPRIAPPPPTDFEPEDIVATAGVGERQAFVVVDFDVSSAASAEFVFSVHFDTPSITGEEILRILDKEAALEITSRTLAWGLMIDAIRYEHEGRVFEGVANDSWPDGTWWSYWLSADCGATWESAMVGASSRILHHGDTDGWLFKPYSDTATAPNGPRPSSFVRTWLRDFGTDAGWSVADHPRELADANGDGLDDIVGFGGDGVHVALSNGTQFATPTLWSSEFGCGKGWRTDVNERLTADLNGDGRADVVAFGAKGVVVALSTGAGFSTPTLVLRDFGLRQGWTPALYPRLLADVDGDAVPDIVGFGQKGTVVALGDGAGGFAAASLWARDFGLRQGWSRDFHIREVADVNGDGRADIVGFGNQGAVVALATESGFGPAALAVRNFGVAQGWQVGWHPRRLADVNGDGRADIVGFGDKSAAVALALEDGAFAPAQVWSKEFGAGDGWRSDRHMRLMGDLDGDGLADIIAFGEAGTLAALSSGIGFTPAIPWVNDFGYAQGWRLDSHLRLLGEVNGDHLLDTVGFFDDGVRVH